MNAQQLFRIGSYVVFSVLLCGNYAIQAKDLNLRNTTSKNLFAAIYYAGKHYGLRVTHAVKTSPSKTTKIKLPSLKGSRRRLLLLSKKSEALKAKMSTKELQNLPIKPLELPLAKSSHVLCSQEAKDQPIIAAPVASWPTLNQAA